MALTQQQKDGVDEMGNTDKALLVLYALGKDDPALAVELGKAFVRVKRPDLDPDALTNNQLGLAFLTSNYDFNYDVFVADNVRQAFLPTDRKTVIDAAGVVFAPDYDIGTLPVPKTETIP